MPCASWRKPSGPCPLIWSWPRRSAANPRQSAVTSQNQPPMGSVYDDVIRSMMAPPAAARPCASGRNAAACRPQPRRRRRRTKPPTGWRWAARWMTTGDDDEDDGGEDDQAKGKKQSAISREPTREQVSRFPSARRRSPNWRCAGQSTTEHVCFRLPFASPPAKPSIPYDPEAVNASYDTYASLLNRPVPLPNISSRCGRRSTVY